MNLVVLGEEDLMWPLGRQTSTPYFTVGAGRYKREQSVDPFPAYPPDPELVARLLDECNERFPLKNCQASMFLLAREGTEKMNGITFSESAWYREDGSEWKDQIKCHCCDKMLEMDGMSHTIVLFAKRIPIHPAMLRYLVAHEYGHAVFNQTRRLMGYKEDEKEKLEQKYMELRGLGEMVKQQKYVGGRWHLSPAEIIANDFRVLVMGRETEFWPHPGISLPDYDSRIADWWYSAFAASGLEPKLAGGPVR